MFSCEICKISMNTFFYRTAPVAASEDELMFSRDPGTKTELTVSNKYLIQLKKSVCFHEHPVVVTLSVLQKKVCKLIYEKEAAVLRNF